jgi:hypothetical protein
MFLCFMFYVWNLVVNLLRPLPAFSDFLPPQLSQFPTSLIVPANFLCLLELFFTSLHVQLFISIPLNVRVSQFFLLL